MSKVYNQEQQEFIRTARQAYVRHVAEIDRQKEYVKETFESLIDKIKQLEQRLGIYST